jgi:hypothetical protein
MSFDKLKTDISYLLTAMQNEPEDAHELYQQIRDKLSEMKAFGMPLPEDLVKLEHALEADFAREKRGG